MNYWILFPFFRYIVFFIPGVLYGLFFAYDIRLISVTGIIVFAFFLFLRLFKSNRYFLVIRILRGIFILNFLFLLGIVSTWVHVEKNHPSHIYNVSNSIDAYTVKVVGQKGKSGNYIKVLAEVRSIKADGFWCDAKGKVLLMVKEEGGISLAKHQVLLVNGAPLEIKASLNPGDFDIKSFYANQNIYHQQFLKSEKIFVLGKIRETSLLDFSSKLREDLEKVLKQNFSDEKTTQIASALLLGEKKNLDKGLQKSYAASGAMHILAVSGLHVGIIFIFLNFIGKLSGRNKWMKRFFPMVSVIILWFYAMITGLSPSVLRSVTMFSFIQIGINFFKGANMINVLALSALILLFLDPLMIMNVGFQLSYLAMLSIILLYPGIYALFVFKVKFVDKVWKVASVSLAAQAGTFFLSVYYFNQFPVYFLLSNLLITVPVFMIIIYGFILLSFSLLFDVPSFFFNILEFKITVLNNIVLAIEKLPLSVITEINFSKLELLLAGISFSVILLFLHKPVIIFYKLFFASFISLLIVNASYNYQKKTRESIMVFNASGANSAVFIKGEKAYVFNENNDDKLIKRNVLPFLKKEKIEALFYRLDQNIKSDAVTSFCRDGITIIDFKGKIIKIVRSSQNEEMLKFPAHYTIFGDYWHAEKLPKESKFIFTGRYPKAEYFYSTAARGAFIENF